MTVEHQRLKGTMQAYVLAEQKVSGTRGLALEMLRAYIKSAGRGASSQLASELEISQQYLSDILTSKRELNLALAERILGVL